MGVRTSINGFGRIGRLLLRSCLESRRDDVDIVAINDLGSAETNAHLLKYDTTHGTLDADISVDGDHIVVDGRRIRVLAEREPHRLPWRDLDVDVVMECTGLFTKRDKAAAHLDAGARRVLISGPAADADITVVYGVNSDLLSADHKVVSNGSCTTNCLAPVAQVLLKTCGIEQGFMSTVHAYTGDQNTVDTLHKDLRRARAAGRSIIPTSTGAARAISLVLPDLAGKLDGAALRVPTTNVSMIDLKVLAERTVTHDEIDAAMRDAAATHLKGILAINDQPLVSSDFNHNPYSSVYDATQTKVIGGTFVRVVSWYDNEWAFSKRMADVASLMTSVH